MNLRWRFAQFFEFWWWKKYLAPKDKEVYLEWKKAYWRAFLKKTGVSILPGSSILDAGCGPAGIYIALSQMNAVDAVDPLLDRYARTLQHFDPADYPTVRFYNQALEDFSPGKRYDIVFCLNAINHVADLQQCLNRLIVSTKPGGHLILSVDAHNFSGLKRLFQWIPGDILHPHQYNLKEYQDMLDRQGGKLVRTVLLKKALIFNYYLLMATLRE